MKTLRPIEIVGGGLAGLSLGLALRRENVPVTLHEAGFYPRHRVCGEFITGLEEATISRLGLEPFLDDALRHREVAWFLDGKSTQVQRLPQPALGLSRHILDARLADAFTSAGGNLRTHSRIPATGRIPGHILATGRRQHRPAWLGLKVHATGLPLIRDLELHLGDQCYLGLARINRDQVNICGLFQNRKLNARGSELLLSYLQASGLTDLAARLGSVELDDTSFCAVAAVGFDRQVPSDGEMRLGDAFAMIPPFTGNGMAMAFQSAETALDPVLNYAQGRLDWDSACAALQTALRHRFRLRLASADLLHPFLLRPSRQRWLSALSRCRLLPLKPLYAALH